MPINTEYLDPLIAMLVEFDKSSPGFLAEMMRALSKARWVGDELHVLVKRKYLTQAKKVLAALGELCEKGANNAHR